jgi:hypothetical protein
MTKHETFFLSQSGRETGKIFFKAIYSEISKRSNVAWQIIPEFIQQKYYKHFSQQNFRKFHEMIQIFCPGKYLEYFICSTEFSKDFTIKIYPILIFIGGRVDTVVHTVHTYVHLTG